VSNIGCAKVFTISDLENYVSVFLTMEKPASVAYILKYYLAFMYTCEVVAIYKLKTGVCFLGSCIYTAGASAIGYPWFNAT
jgi:hypothetical protein